MGDSWGHTLQKLSGEELARLKQRDEHDIAKWGRSFGIAACTIGRVTHQEPATYLGTYRYVTGRAGRVSFARKRMCDGHAAKFAAKYGLDLDSVPTLPVPKHIGEELLEQLTDAFPKEQP